MVTVIAQMLSQKPEHCPWFFSFPHSPYLTRPVVTFLGLPSTAYCILLCNPTFVPSLRHVQLFCDSMDCSPPGSSFHGKFQARVLEWVAVSFSRGSSPPRFQASVSCINRWILYHWATQETLHKLSHFFSCFNHHIGSPASFSAFTLSFFTLFSSPQPEWSKITRGL